MLFNLDISSGQSRANQIRSATLSSKPKSQSPISRLTNQQLLPRKTDSLTQPSLALSHSHTHHTQRAMILIISLPSLSPLIIFPIVPSNFPSSSLPFS